MREYFGNEDRFCHDVQGSMRLLRRHKDSTKDGSPAPLCHLELVLRPKGHPPSERSPQPIDLYIASTTLLLLS